MIWFLILVALGGGIAVGVALSKRQKQRALPQAEQLKQLEAATSVERLQIGDIVVHYDREYIVEGKLTYTEEGFSWYEYMLVDGNEVVWLTVEDDDQLSVSLSTEAEFAVTTTPGRSLDVDGVTYQLAEKGRARMTRQGETGKKGAEVCTYYEYRASGNRQLSVEQWGQSFEVFHVRPVTEAELDILPGGTQEDR